MGSQLRFHLVQHLRFYNMSDLKVDGITASTGTNTNIAITGKGSGKVAIGDGTLLFPDSDGSAGTAIVTNGSGTLSFAATGVVLQRVFTQTGAVATSTATIPTDDTIPQKTEGTEFMTLAITPLSTSSVLVVEVSFIFSGTTGGTTVCALFRDDTANALATNWSYQSSSGEMDEMNLHHAVVSGSLSATTFKVRAGFGSTLTFNGQSSARKFGGTMASGIWITEYKP